MKSAHGSQEKKQKGNPGSAQLAPSFSWASHALEADDRRPEKAEALSYALFSPPCCVLPLGETVTACGPDVVLQAFELRCQTTVQVENGACVFAVE